MIMINCPVTWYTRYEWLRARDSHYLDTTNWPMWQIGMGDIFISVDDEVATLYYLTWKNSEYR
jgi:hypothetical protein